MVVNRCFNWSYKVKSQGVKSGDVAQGILWPRNVHDNHFIETRPEINFS